MASFWILMAILVTWLVLTAVGVTLFVRHLERRNRVHPDVPSLAPLLWLYSPSQPAVMHRRLHTAVLRVDMATLGQTPSSPAHDLRDELGAQAVELDRHIVHATSLPRSRRRVAMRALHPQVIELDQLSLRLIAVAQAARPRPGSIPSDPRTALNDIARRLDLIEQAQAEIDQIERSAGLVDLEEAYRTVAGTPGATAAATVPPVPGTGPVPLPAPNLADRLPPRPSPPPETVPRSRSAGGRRPA